MSLKSNTSVSDGFNLSPFAIIKSKYSGKFIPSYCICSASS